MNKLVVTVSIIGVITGCASSVSNGERVFITPSDSAHLSNCKMLGQVKVDASIAMLWDRNQQVMEIKNTGRCKFLDSLEIDNPKEILQKIL